MHKFWLLLNVIFGVGKRIVDFYKFLHLYKILITFELQHTVTVELGFVTHCKPLRWLF